MSLAWSETVSEPWRNGCELVAKPLCETAAKPFRSRGDAVANLLRNNRKLRNHFVFVLFAYRFHIVLYSYAVVAILFAFMLFLYRLKPWRIRGEPTLQLTINFVASGSWLYQVPEAYG